MSFWEKLSKPFFVMAPLADVTDPAWRALVARSGAPDVFWTEFVSADGLYHTRKPHVGFTKPYMRDCDNPLARDLSFTEDERPIVAQLFSADPAMMAYGAKLVHELGFDGMDINMGCPDAAVERQGCGAALIKNPKRAQELIRAAKEASPLPVSVKTRVGYDRESLDDWLPALLEAAPAAITLHLRTRRQMSLVPADWELMRKAVAIRDRIAPGVLLIGNGDITDLEDARAKVSAAACDGAMIGRGMFGNPWVFAGRKPEETPLAEKLAALAALAKDFEALRPRKNFSILKKHIKAFVTGFEGAAELRAKLMEAENADELAASIGV